MLSILRLLLWPISLIYELVIRVRNYMYDRGILKSTRFSFPVIVVGNLAVGGTGKSPTTELLVNMLKGSYKLAVLSRGYGRKTSGFLYVEPSYSPKHVGDEPLQFKNRFPETTIAVCEDRVAGVSKLQNDHEVVVLDDAYQHRALTPGLSILLIEYQSLFKAKTLLPTGNFRDTFSQRKRADVIIISKCPDQLSEEDKQHALTNLKADMSQAVFFSYLIYNHPHAVFTSEVAEIEFPEMPIYAEDDILLVTGIAKPQPLQRYLENRCKTLKILQYPDHHLFSEKDIHRVINEFSAIRSSRKYILTTEKDYQRFKDFSHKFSYLAPSSVRVIGIEISFHDGGQSALTSLVHQYCKETFDES